MERKPALLSVWTAEDTMALQRLHLGVQPADSTPGGSLIRPGHGVQPVPEDLLRSPLALSGNLHLLTLGQPSSVHHPDAMAGPIAEAPGVFQPGNMQQGNLQAVSKAGGRSQSSNMQPARATAAVQASQMVEVLPGLPLQPMTTPVPKQQQQQQQQHQAKAARRGRSSSRRFFHSDIARQQHAQLEVRPRVELQPITATPRPSDQQQAGLLRPGWQSQRMRPASFAPQQQQAGRGTSSPQPRHAQQYQRGSGVSQRSLHPSAELGPQVQPIQQHKPYRPLMPTNSIPVPQQRQRRKPAC